MFNKALVFLWVSSLLCSTVGVSIHKIYCYCLDESTFTLFEPKHTCQAEVANIVEKTSAECCSKSPKEKQSCCETKTASESKGCTNTSTKHFKLKTDLEVVKVTEKQHFSTDVDTRSPEFVPAFATLLAGVEQVHLNKAPPQPPPPLTGRTLCIRYQCFLC